MNRRNSFLNRACKNSKNSITPKNAIKSTPVKQYDETFVRQLRRTVHRQPLPELTMQILTSNCLLRSTLSAEDKKAFIDSIAHLDTKQCEKSIRGLCNKICENMYKRITCKLLLLLNKHQFDAHLIDHLIQTLIRCALNLIVVTDSNEASQFTRLYYYALVLDHLNKEIQIHDKICTVLNDNIHLYLQNKNVSSDLSDYDVYQKNKRIFINLFMLLACLSDLNFFAPQKILRQKMQHMFKTILNANRGFNDTYVNTYCIVHKHVKKRFVRNSEINAILANAQLSTKARLDLMNLQDAINEK